MVAIQLVYVVVLQFWRWWETVKTWGETLWLSVAVLTVTRQWIKKRIFFGWSAKIGRHGMLPS